MERSLTNAVFVIISIFIISIFLVFDLFIHSGQPVTFDGPTHITNIAQVYGAMRDGEFPARWGGGFARYGLPIPTIAQQVPSYLGAFLTSLTHDVVMSYNLVVFIGAVLSTAFLYIFLRFYVSPLSAFVGAFLFNFAPYRVMNVFIRGALPEFFASTFVILILIALYLAIKKEKISGYLLLTLSLTLLFLTHPFLAVIGSFIFVPYGFFLLWEKKFKGISKIILLSGSSAGLALSIAAYYLMPLFLEIKYFYYGIGTSHYAQGHTLSLMNFFTESWYYFYKGDVFPRGHVHLGGIIEGTILLAGIAYSVWLFLKHKKIDLVVIYSLSGIVIILFTLPLAEPLYTSTPFGNIQHPWRMLSAYIFIAPIIIALLVEKIPRTMFASVLVILVIAVLRFPQLYGKNYIQYPQLSYFNTDYNLHGVVMDTIWMGEERTYPYQKQKVKIIEGKGKITDLTIKNASRTYAIDAESDIRIADYTFYFPGWKTYVDGAETTIEFQDPYYRGVITYKIPTGHHQIVSRFEETKVRKIGNIITLLSFAAFIALWYFRDTIQKKLYAHTS